MNGSTRPYLPDFFTLTVCTLGTALLAGCGSSAGEMAGTLDSQGGVDSEGGVDSGGVGESGRVEDAGNPVPTETMTVEAGGQQEGGTAEGGKQEAGAPESGAPDTGSNEPAFDAAVPADLVTVALSGCVPFYTASVTIGGGTETFALILDTGSTTLAVASSTCTDCTGVSPLYTPSTSAVNEHKTVSSTYGGGAMWSGAVYEDGVSMGTPTASASVMLADIDSQSQFFTGSIACGPSATTYSYQGIVGFALGRDAVMGTDGFFDQFLAANPSMANVFATELCDTGGTLWLGGYDPGAVTAAPQYTPLTDAESALYSVDLEQVSVAGTSADVPTGTYTESILDTGTSLFYLQPTAFSAITTAIAGSTGFQTIFGGAGASFFSSPDNTATLAQTKAELDATLPAMTLVFGTSPAVSVSATATESYLISYSPGRWSPAILSSTPSAALPLASIIGSPMLRSSVVIFDRAAMRIGFAPHAPCP
jgi:hypothetical protein